MTVSIIRIEGRTVYGGLFGNPTPFDHLYLVHVNNSGVETVLRAGSDASGPQIAVEYGLLAESSDRRLDDSLENRGSKIIELNGRDANNI